MNKNFITRIGIACAAMMLAAVSAQAATINFGNGDLSQSTLEGAGAFIEITAPGVDPSNIPADGTFVNPYNGTIASGNAGKWYRYNFNLPSGFTNLSMTIQLSVDNEVQLFLNDMIAAVEDDTVVQNFNAPFPMFTLASNNTVTNNSGTWDVLPINQSMFQTGPNELTFFATNNGGPGNFNLLNGTITYDVSAIPEPTTSVLFGLGLVGLFAMRRRKR